MNVFDIKQEYRALRELAEDFEVDENGEFIDRSSTIAEMLEDINGTTSDKLDSIEYIKREIVGSIDVLKSEESRLNKKRKTLENRIDHLKSLQLALLHETYNKCKTDLFSFSVRKSESVEFKPFVEPAMLEDEYKTINTTVSADKKAIKEAINNGIEVKGCYIAINESVGVR